MAESRFTVPDMDCASCVTSITSAVQRVDAQASVSADLTTKQVVVASTAATSQIATAIEDAGFTLEPA